MCMTVMGEDGKLHRYGGNEVELVGKIGDKKDIPITNEEIVKSVSEGVREAVENAMKVNIWQNLFQSLYPLSPYKTL